MARDRDDALAWEGDDDPTLDLGPDSVPESDAPSALPAGWKTVGKGSEPASTGETPSITKPPPRATAPVADAAVSTAPDTGPVAVIEESTPTGNVGLVGLGVLGGISLLYAIGWLIGGLRVQGQYQVLVSDAMYQGALILATAAPLVWFATVIYVTRLSRPWVRYIWLAAGVLLLVPWPFIMIGVVGQ